MKHIAVSISSCVLALGLVACDKKGEADQSAEANTEDKKEEASKEAAAKQDDKPVAEAKAEPEPADTKGMGGVIHATAGDEKPTEAAPTEAAPTEAPPTEVAAPEPPAEVPHFDTSKDKGSMIGHLAGSLVHDDDLAAARDAMATLASLAVGDTTPSDAVICGHVWKTVFVTQFPDMADQELEVEFMRMCKLEIEKERLKLGPQVFAEAAACIMAADSMEALELCDKAEKQAEQELHEKPHGDKLDKATCEAAVDHMFALLRKEMGDDAEVAKSLEVDLENLKADAVLMCMDEATRAEIDCLMKAKSFTDLQACDA